MRRVVFEEGFCRATQLGLRAVLPALPYREPEVLSSCGDLRPVLERENVARALVMTSPCIVRGGLG